MPAPCLRFGSCSRSEPVDTARNTPWWVTHCMTWVWRTFCFATTRKPRRPLLEQLSFETGPRDAIHQKLWYVPSWTDVEEKGYNTTFYC